MVFISTVDFLDHLFSQTVHSTNNIWASRRSISTFFNIRNERMGKTNTVTAFREDKQIRVGKCLYQCFGRSSSGCHGSK